MRVFIISVIIVALAFFASCNKPAGSPDNKEAGNLAAPSEIISVEVGHTQDSATFTNKESEGQTTIEAGRSSKLPEGWPSSIPQYPGSAVTNSMATDTSAGKAINLVMETADAPAKVSDFYADKLKRAGYKKSAEISKDDGVTLIYDSPEHTLTMTVFTENNKTIISASATPKG